MLSRLRDRVSLCINSFSTPKGGLTARLVDVGDGSQAAHYENLDVKGAVVLGDADAGRLWQHAVKARGAVGVISTRVAPYIRPSDPKLFTSPDQHEVFQWGSIPYDADVKAFGFKASWRAASRMRERLQERAGASQGRHRIHLLRRPDPHARRRDSRARSSPTSASSWRRTSRSRAPTTTRADAATLYALARALWRASPTAAVCRRPAAR